MIDKISKDIYSLYKVYLKVSDVSINQLIDIAYDPRFGARNLERVIRDEIEDKVAKIILSGKAKPGETIDL
jgi:ATP-dependent Clp protease ATP-binding subunit ClpA